MSVLLILYIPVLHRGYMDLLKKYQAVDCVYVLGQEFIDELAEHKEIRALEPFVACQVVASLGIVREVKVLDRHELLKWRDSISIITADEAITHALIDRYLSCVAEVTFEKTFLRWEESNVLSLNDVPFDRISRDAVDRERMLIAESEAKFSSDWWRQVGAVLITKKSTVLKSSNQHVPSEHTPYINGDPRDSIKAGTRSELSSVLHSEKAVFAEALRRGVSTEGADLYTTVFPCPDCAKLIAYSGVKRLFFKGGHASLDGAHVLKAKGVEIIKVE